MSELPVYLSLQEAVDLYAIDLALLVEAVNGGTVQAFKTSTGDVLVARADVGTMCIEIPVDPDLTGRPIRLNEAAEKYDVEHQSLSRWAYSGYIRILEQASKVLVLDEADVKRVAEIFHRARRETGSYVQAGWILKRMLDDSAPQTD